MTKEITPNLLILEGFILEVSRLPDTPLNKGDRVVYTDRYSGRIVIARAPILIDPVAASTAL